MSSWLLLAAVSALVLGVYDVAKKASLNGNAVLPVLWATSLCAFVLALPALWWPGIGSITWHAHLLILAKSGIVTLSWVLTYFAIKHLPISLGTPLRASAPLFTVLGAVFLFGEMPLLHQWLGIALMLAGYWGFSLVGQKEGVHFRSSKWVWMMLAGTAVAACSGLYDKVLLQKAGLQPLAVQFWFSAYNALVQAPIILFLWWPRRASNTPFQWRWSILWVAALLLVADVAYFHAMANPDALVSVVSVVRRSNVVVSFLLGGFAFHERNRRRKAALLLLVLAGLVLVMV